MQMNQMNEIEREYKMEEKIYIDQPPPVQATPIPPKLIEGNYRGQRLTVGLKGEPVRQFQELLAEKTKSEKSQMSLLRNGVSGVFDEKTEQAVIELQRKEGMAETGQATTELYEVLKKT